MCLGPSSPPAAPPPLPAVAPPPVATLESADGQQTKDGAAITANRGRSQLRIDKTQNVPGAAGSGLNIPT